MFTKVVILAALLAAASAVVEDPQFQEWLSEHQLEFDDEDSIYPVWKKNAEFVQRHNSLGLSHTVSLNKFAHLGPKDLVKNSPMRVAPYKYPHTRENVDLPASIDWREKGAVTPVMNQGQDGSAVAFAIVDSVASFGFIENNVLQMPSVQEYVDCCGQTTGGIFGAGDYKCIAGLGGLSCDYKPGNNSECRSKDFKPCVVIKGGAQVESGNEEALAVALLRQPIAVAIDASQSSFQLYHSGIYYNRNCTSTKLDHAMLLVGYGSENGQDFWIVKNSWGKSWGMDGYVMMSRNKKNNCGIATNAIYPK